MHVFLSSLIQLAGLAPGINNISSRLGPWPLGGSPTPPLLGGTKTKYCLEPPKGQSQPCQLAFLAVSHSADNALQTFWEHGTFDFVAALQSQQLKETSQKKHVLKSMARKRLTRSDEKCSRGVSFLTKFD